MSPRDVFAKGSLPAWISCAAAAIIAVFALWSNAAAPAQDRLRDHEMRLRELEDTANSELSEIKTELQALRRDVQALRQYDEP